MNNTEKGGDIPSNQLNNFHATATGTRTPCGTTCTWVSTLENFAEGAVFKLCLPAASKYRCLDQLIQTDLNARGFQMLKKRNAREKETDEAIWQAKCVSFLPWRLALRCVRRANQARLSLSKEAHNGSGGETRSTHIAPAPAFLTTIMSTPRLPAELLDHVVDDLRSTNDALKNCCLVSKSWIPRTRQHLFYSVDLSTVAILQSWKQTFPNPSTSPAYYTKLLVIRCPQVVTVVDAEDGGWLSAFSRVECLVIVIPIVGELKISLAPFYGLSPVTKSLRVVLAAFQSRPSPSRVFDFICSFPLLEDLSVDACERFANPDGSDGQQTPVQIPNPPKFSGLLELSLAGGLNPFIGRFLSLPSDLHFRILTLTCANEGDISLVKAMVDKCCHTLEYLRIYDRLPGVFFQCLALPRND